MRALHFRRVALASTGFRSAGVRTAVSTSTSGPMPRQSRPILSVEEALYLAKEAGYFTTEERQLQIVRSPPFSPRERPFIIENFFDSLDDGQADEDGGDDVEEEVGNEDEAANVSAPPAIHQTIQRHFRPDLPNTFLHSGKEWLVRAEGRGTRKRASAHALLVRGAGAIKVNGEEDLYSRWPLIYNRFDVCQPFKLTGTACVFDLFLDVRGGGTSGQAGAARLAVARALLEANPACHDDLQKGYCLYEDTRQKLSKMPGKKGARASFHWAKR